MNFYTLNFLLNFSNHKVQIQKSKIQLLQDEFTKDILKSNGKQFFSFTKLFRLDKYGLILLILFALPFIVYWQTINFELVWDDFGHTTNNEYLDPINLENLSHFWTEIFWGLYIPVSYTLWAGIMKLSLLTGLDSHYSMIFHLVNIILHSINGLLVFTLLHHFITNKWHALIGTLFFLFHPIQVESVAWISEFRGLLSFCFGFTALYLYLKSCDLKYVKYKKKSSNRYFIYGLLFFILGILSKPSIVVVIFFAIILEYYLYRPTLFALVKRILPYTVPVLAIIFITTSAQGGESNVAYPIWLRPLVFSDSLLFYLKKIIIPVNFLAGYGRTTESISNSWWFYSSWILFVGMVGVFVRYWQKINLIVIGASLFLFGLLTVSGLIQFVFQLWSNVADRYIYTSMFGISLIISAILELIKTNKLTTYVFSGIIISILIFLSFQQIPVWKNKFTLWDHTLKSNPMEYRAFLNRGLWYSNNGEVDKAITDIKESIRICPEYGLGYYNLGLIFSNQKEFDKAIRYFDTAIIFNEDPKYLIGRAKAYTDSEQYALAVQDCYRIINIYGEDEKVFYQLGYINLIVENYEFAIMEFDKCINLNTNNEQAYYNRGHAYMKLRKFKLAAKDYKRAIKLKPDYELAIEALAVVSKFL